MNASQLSRKLWAGLFAVFAALACAAGVWWAGRADRALAAARAALDAGEVDEALALLPLAEAGETTREKALLLRARLCLDSGDLKGAAHSLDGVRADGPLAGEHAYWKGRTLYAAGQPRLAAPWLATAVRHAPDHADALRWLAAAAYDLGDRDTAVRSLETVARLEPRDARVWRTLGLIFRENVDHDRARDAFQRSIELDRGQPEVRLDLAAERLELGDPAGAEAELEACRGRVPEGARAEVLAGCLRLRGDAEAFRKAVAAGLAAEPGRPGLLALQAQVDQSDGKPEAALVRLDQAVGADPHRAEFYYQRSLLHRQLGRREQAEADSNHAASLKRALASMSAMNDEAARNPTDAGIRHRLGEICLELGKTELAASWFRAAVACDPKHEASLQALAALGPAAATPRPRGTFPAR